ncbi:SCAN domain-containing protein 3-like [Homarus americanus]|uniref:SCAN domain-containing protein 3-like n=1 Tax=Homarus americanus TaxID=6706 RepID=UPI001C490264|nr:SCAN domain-containing protein 3-like [Homarus americanus]
MTSLTIIPQKAQRASYLTGQRVAKSKKSHTIWEELMLPAVVEMCEVMIGKEAASQLKSVSLSTDTVRSRIEDMSCDIKSQLVARLQTCHFSIHLNESTYLSNSAQLIELVRYPWNGHIFEDFFFCKKVTVRATDEEIFNILDTFMRETKMKWENCVAVCTDGAAVMTGRKSGVVARIKALNPQIIATHCLLHRQALASKDMAPDLHSVLSTVVFVVNYVKSRLLQSRLFAQLCNKMCAGHDTLLFHSKVRWLSRGKVLQRVFELRTELCEFLKDAKPTTVALLSEPDWIAQLSYLAEVFNILNELNLSTQGGYASILEVSDEIKVFREKTEIWRMREYPELVATTMKILLPFPTTYLCEASFSALTTMKTKFRARMHVENDPRVCLLSIPPRIEKLCTERQANISH